MQIDEFISSFLEELKERIGSFTIEEQDNTHLVITTQEDNEYVSCILMEMTADFSGEYLVHTEMTPFYDGDPQAFKIEFFELD